MSFLIIGSDGYLASAFKKILKKKQERFFEEKYENFLNYNIDLNKYDKKIKTIIHFAITNNLGELTNLNKDIKFAKLLARFCKINKINFIYISSISAFKNNNSRYGILKYKIEKEVKKYGATIIRPGMVWDFSPGSWFKRIEKLVDRLFIFMPLLGFINNPVYLVYKKDLIEKIFYISKKKIKYPRKSNTFVIASKNTHSLREIVYFLAKRKSKYFLFFPIPFFLIKLSLKILVLIKVIDYNFYDSCLSYQYNKFHSFENCTLINTKKNYESISLKK